VLKQTSVDSRAHIVTIASSSMDRVWIESAWRKSSTRRPRFV